MAELARLMEVLESEGPVSASRLSAALAVSQPTLSRLLSKAGSRVLRIGQARATRYVARRALMGNDDPITLYAIDAKGRPEHIAGLHGLARDQYYVDTMHGDFWLRGEAINGVYKSLPYFLDDVRPQGFMGRQIARRYCGGLMARPDRFLLGRHARRSVNYACLIENAPPGCLVCSAIE